MAPGSLPPPAMRAGIEKQTLTLPVQQSSSSSSSNITQDQVISRVRDLLTPLILENALLRDKGSEGSLAQKRKVLADKTQVLLGDDGLCMSFVKNAIDVHVALIDAGKIKSSEELRDPRQTGTSLDGHPESVGTDNNAMPPRFTIRGGEGSIERLPPLYFSMHDDKEKQSPQLPPRPHPPPPSAPKSMRTTPHTSASPSRETFQEEGRQDAPVRHYSPSSASKASDDGRRKGRSRSRSIPRWERPLAQGRFQTRRSLSRSRSKSPPPRRSVTPHRLPTTSRFGNKDMARSRSPRRRNRSPGPGPPRPFSPYSRRRRFSPPPTSASSRFPGKAGPSKYPLRRGYRSRSTSRSPERNRRRRKDSYSPPPRRREEYKKQGRRRDSPSPPPRRKYEPKVRSRSREDPPSWKPRRRYNSRSRSPGERPSTSTWKKPHVRPVSPRTERRFSGHERDNGWPRPSGYAPPAKPSESREEERQRLRPYNTYASPFEIRGSASPPREGNLQTAPVREGVRSTASLDDVRVKREQSGMQGSLFRTARLEDDREPGQISSSPSKDTDIHNLAVARSSASIGGDIPGLVTSTSRKSMFGGRFDDEEDRKPDVVELERQRLAALKRTSSPPHRQQEATLPCVDESVDTSRTRLMPPGTTRRDEEDGEGQGEERVSIPVQAGKKRERSINPQGEQDEDQTKRKRGRSLEIEREQVVGGLNVAGPEELNRTEDQGERVLLQAQAPLVLERGNTEGEEEGTTMVESPQSMESPALPPAPEPVLPCHFVPGVWYIQNGSNIMETQDCHFEIDQATADRWGLASR
ncbi:hypothetical protein BKA70DRAFT_719676 [Coprinopsis sp. MPI-PUGE-AT-0042]|nr:hypothetical protein BKA70DRAFT_719676 [Coprinopsis sp. MPI-PUGE-AT-0042]